ncbi:MAG TPA: bifunctional 5,10-methylenetetrahydrofolate dehydrogenase/5,10-methenyltetrahydrofolate cyclohydrolase [Candidatus Lokiarchaeia archaeon]|nr:bifunctional 5,10-methylenetetrahydrofolate dehydrogenase/5,10-methenyltetrahydrofolate cyclohydrolase [Candidatus Lokiarchaeia archaeon]
MSIDPSKILDGKACSAQVRESLKPRIEELGDNGIQPGLATVLVGDDPASKTYVTNKHKACADLGMKSVQIELPEETTEAELLEAVAQLNADPNVHGILVQVPLPTQINVENILPAIDVKKDVDGFHPQNLGNLLRNNGKELFTSCTPAGIIQLLKFGEVELKGLDVVIVNRSNIVGRPLIPLFLRENATVTVCHTSTRDLASHTRRADLVVTGVGKAKMFNGDYFKEGVVIIDVSMNHTEEGVLVGDVDMESVADIVSKISPVPGGVGPMTIALLLSNTVKAAELQS